MSSQIDFIGNPVIQVVDGNGVPVAGALIWCYDSGTTNIRDMYATVDDALNHVNPVDNPFETDSAGRASLVFAGPSTITVENNDIDPDTGHGTVLWSVDDIGRFGNTVIDPNGNIIVQYNYQANAVNYLKFSNAGTGLPVSIRAQGGDNNVGLQIVAGGSGVIGILNANNGGYTIPTTSGSAGSVLTLANSTTAAWLPAPGVSQVNPPGMIADFAMASPPTGWLNCDHSAVSRATYAALFAVIGTTWGAGDGVNTFNLPDFRGYVRMGSGQGYADVVTGSITGAVGEHGGEATHVITAAESNPHTHTYTYNSSNYSPVVFNAGGGGVTTASLGLADSVNANATGSSGSGGAHNNIQPSAVVLTCIKT